MKRWIRERIEMAEQLSPSRQRNKRRYGFRKPETLPDYERKKPSTKFLTDADIEHLEDMYRPFSDDYPMRLGVGRMLIHTVKELRKRAALSNSTEPPTATSSTPKESA